ncbi:MAG: hypothetical protein KDC35_20665 [Acidobacteria bacterium]|nr:hypothetical protein [Acidobacteriota bacterium]
MRYALLLCLSTPIWSQSARSEEPWGPVVVPVVLDHEQVAATGVGLGDLVWAEVAYLSAPDGEAVAFEPAEQIWWLADRPVLLLGATGNPVPRAIIERGTAWIQIDVNGMPLTETPMVIYPRAKRIRLSPDAAGMQRALARGLPGVDGTYLAQVANFLAGNLAALDVTGTSYSISGFGTVIDGSGDWVGGNLSAMGTVVSDGSLTLDGSSDLITAGSGTLSLDDDHLTTTGNIGIGTSMPSEALTLNGGNLLQIMGDPRHEGAVSLTGTFPRSLYVRGNYAYVGMWGGDQFHVVDVRNPNTPVVVGTLVDDGTTALDAPTDVIVVGNYAYVTSGADHGLEIIDVSNPTAPTHVSALFDTVETALAGAAGIKLVGPYAYIASNTNSGLQIVDISNPTNPRAMGVIFDNGTTALGGAINLDVCGNYAYVTGPFEGLEILDISDPHNPQHAGALFDDGSIHLAGCREIRVDGRYAYITATTENALSIVDVSDPTAPMEVGFLVDNGSTSFQSPRGLALAGNYVFIAGEDDNAVSVIDVSDPTAPVEVGGIVDNGASELAGAYDVVVSGIHAYAVGQFDQGLEVVALTGSQFHTMEVVSLKSDTLLVAQNTRMNGNLDVQKDVSVGGDVHLRDALTFGTLRQIPLVPKVVGTLSIPDNPQGTAVSGDYAFVVCGISDDLHVIDISSPSSPFLVSSTLLSGASAVEVCGRLAYVASQTSGLSILDVSDPKSPDILVQNYTVALSGNMRVSGSYAYFTSPTSSWFRIIDVSNPVAPAMVSSLTYGGGQPGVLDVAGGFAYIIDGSLNTLRIVDVRDPATPTNRGVVTTGEAPREIRVRGRYAYTVDSFDEILQVFDVSDPDNPAHVVDFTIGTEPISFDFMGDYLCVVDRNSDDVKIIDISDPTQPSLVAALVLGTGLFPNTITVEGGFAYIDGNNTDTLRIVDLLGARMASVNAGPTITDQLTVRRDFRSVGNVKAEMGLNVGGDVAIGGDLGLRGRQNLHGTLVLSNYSQPAASIAESVILFAEDTAASAELKVRDEAGNITTLSPHNFSLIGAPSEPLAWSFYSEQNGRAVNVDMLRAVRLIEQVTGEQLVFTAPETGSKPEASYRNRIEALEARNRELEEAVRLLMSERDPQ